MGGTAPAAPLVFVSAIALLSLLPVVSANQAILNWAFLVLLYAALAQSWNLLGGFGGQVNLGHAAFFGLGALVTRRLWLGGLPFGAALLLGTLASAGMGVLVGVPSLRLRGPYFAIGTLAVAEILRITVGNALPQVSVLPAQALATYTLVPRYYLSLVLAAGITAAVWWLARSRIGYGIAAVREDEGVAEAIGVNAFRHKLGAFVLSGCFAGLVGGEFAYYHVSFYPSFAFSPLWTFDPLLITYLGGVGTVWGPLIGAVFFLSL
ncbi:MAG TPA: branched-chain amino acid ABC transporter permease, partial [bacterium]|nr:branched-chain amino acid ABC transporter permease [bacterium]